VAELYVTKASFVLIKAYCFYLTKISDGHTLSTYSKDPPAQNITTGVIYIYHSNSTHCSHLTHYGAGSLCGSSVSVRGTEQSKSGSNSPF
jgi:hypothetical protein